MHPLFLIDFNEIWIYARVFQKYININFHANPQIGRRIAPCRRTDGQTEFTRPIVASRNFAKAPKNCPRQMCQAPFAFTPHNIFSKILLTLTPPLCLDCWVLCQPIACTCEILSSVRGVAEDYTRIIVGQCTMPNVKYLPTLRMKVVPSYSE